MFHSKLKIDDRIILSDLSYHDLGDDWENSLGTVIGFEEYKGNLKNSDGSDINRKIIVWVDNMPYEEEFFDFQILPIDFYKLSKDIINHSSFEFIAKKIYPIFSEEINSKAHTKNITDVIATLNNLNIHYSSSSLKDDLISFLSKAIFDDYELYEELSVFLIDKSFDKSEKINTDLIGKNVLVDDNNEIQYIQVGFVNHFDQFTGLIFFYDKNEKQTSLGYFINGSCINHLAEQLQANLETYYTNIIGVQNFKILKDMLFEDFIKQSNSYLFDTSKINILYHDNLSSYYDLKLFNKGCSYDLVPFENFFFD